MFVTLYARFKMACPASAIPALRAPAIDRLNYYAKMMTSASAHLDALENHSIFILREAHQAFRKMAMPWSIGKDSNVLLWLSLKAFFGKIPYPLLHIDTTYEFPEMLEFGRGRVNNTASG